MQEAMSGHGGGGGRGGMGGGGHGGGGGRGGMGDGGYGGGGHGGGGGRERPDPEQMRRRMESMLEGLRTLDIAHNGEEITILYADGRRRSLFADGETHARETGLGDAEVKARWKGDKLVVKTENEMGRKMTEKFHLGAEGDLLEVETTIHGDGMRPDMTFERVYIRQVDRSEAPAGLD